MTTLSRIATGIALLALAGCYEPASRYDSKSGTYRPTDELRERERELERRIDRVERELERR